MHYTSHRAVLPEHNARYENGDTLTLGDGTEWEYFEASGWVPVAVRPVTNPVTGGITKIATLTQAQYDALATKAADTLYIIVAG